MTPLIFRYDVHSPWCYLAALRIEGIAARHGRAVEWRPVYLARLIDAIDGRRPLEANAAFLAWYRQDLQDWAALGGVTLRYHPRYPLRPARALRAACFASAEGKGGAFARAVLRAYWSEAGDIEDLALLGRLGAEAGLDPQAVIAATSDERWKNQLAANTEEAISAGVFGLPMVTADGKLFFGNDRLDLLDRFLGGTLRS
ncbi:2-hydroxychromene-2-carboxylate isomerase [Roseococcus sp. SDR]|uniref:2-hydroxychromene-2-carboxylate isomerase n=1 Tax=Roseococcus sp. SDR TaxID=2835532 RepID=UPI001BD1A962|nr:2-hydroxychromene-2-carboxylate isomerase [Roseococcus sp. SDR]MBS7792762.1 2-hydroxychromene-2-carboxylate isomerase [Roseococcus sp. SDR]MBV1848076.1 2-hydroxychromene-2-carboxylate isomerase [Roseococcus sp. SDR]